MSTNENLEKLYNEQDFSSWSESVGLTPDEEVLLGRHLFPGTSREARVLDVGTGGGRLAFEVKARGFERVTGIDLSERMVEAARARSSRENANLHFEVQDVVELTLPDHSFEVVLALQQVMCLLDSSARRVQALRHLHRVLVPDGLLLISVLSWEGRPLNPWLAAASAPFKWLKGERRFDRHYLPLLRMSGKLNLRFAFEKQPYVYFFTKPQFEKELAEARFEILGMASSRMLSKGEERFAHGGYLYAFARRRG